MQLTVPFIQHANLKQVQNIVMVHCAVIYQRATGYPTLVAHHNILTQGLIRMRSMY